MKKVKDQREKGKGILGRDRDSHPSYGMVSLSQVSQGGKGAQLFGSGIRHGHYMQLTVETGVRHRNEYSDHYFGRKTIVQVYLSAAQLAGLMTRTNTPGVPCTIRYMDGKYIESPPDYNMKEELLDDLKSQFKDLAKRVSKLENEIEDDLKGPVNKATKEKINHNVLKICQDIRGNLTYLQRCQTEKLESVGYEIMAEAEASINGMIQAAGLEALQGQCKVLNLKTKKKKKVFGRITK